MHISKKKLDEAARVPFKLDGRIMYASERLELIHLALKPGEGMDLHNQPFDVIFFVISGKGVLRTEKDPVEGETGCSIHVPAGVMRGWKNTGESELRILVIKDLK